jgi:hypothetical protein
MKHDTGWKSIVPEENQPKGQIEPILAQADPRWSQHYSPGPPGAHVDSLPYQVVYFNAHDGVFFCFTAYDRLLVGEPAMCYYRTQVLIRIQGG